MYSNDGPMTLFDWKVQKITLPPVPFIGQNVFIFILRCPQFIRVHQTEDKEENQDYVVFPKVSASPLNLVSVANKIGYPEQLIY